MSDTRNSGDKKLSFVVDVESKGRRDVGVAEISVERLKASLSATTAALAEVFQDLRQVGNFQLSEVTIGLEVTAEGGINFIGTTKVSGSGSITLKFQAPTATKV